MNPRALGKDCKATRQGDEYFCPRCALRWSASGGYIPSPVVRKCSEQYGELLSNNSKKDVDDAGIT